MKKKNYLFISVVALFFISCNPTTPTVKNTLEINVGNKTEIFSKGSGSLFDDSNVDSIKIRAFYNNDGSLIPDSDLTLTKLNNRWHASFQYNPASITSEVVFHAMAFNTEGEIIYQGTTASSNIQDLGSSITIPTSSGYEIGDRGPGGGWIIYDKHSFGNDNTMGKSWRYFEIASQDLEKKWSTSSAKLNFDNVQVAPATGKVYTKGLSQTPENLVLDTTSFYWSTSGTFSTESQIKSGHNNTNKLDAISSATPKIGKNAPGRKNSGDILNIRRDTAKILKEKQINKFSDWFIPSKDELGSIYANKDSFPIANFNLQEDVYWTSSEDNDNISKTTTDSDFIGKTDEIESDAYWAWAIDFSKNTIDSAKVLTERYKTHKVRPIRAF